MKLHERLDYGVKLNTVCAQVSAHFRLLVVVVAYVAQVTNVSNTASGRRRTHRPLFCRAFVLLLGSLLSLLSPSSLFLFASPRRRAPSKRTRLRHHHSSLGSFKKSLSLLCIKVLVFLSRECTQKSYLYRVSTFVRTISSQQAYVKTRRVKGNYKREGTLLPPIHLLHLHLLCARLTAITPFLL